MALFNFQVGQTQAQQLQAKALEEQQAARARQAAGLKSALSPFGAETAGELGGLMTSGVPALESLGAGQLAELQARRSNLPAAPASPMDQAKLASEQALAEQRRASAASSRAQVGNYSATNKQALDRIEREEQAGRIKNRSDLQSVLQGNNAISVGVEAAKAYERLDATMTAPGAGPLEIANAAVLLMNIIEPGRAVMNDDRVAITSNASSGVTEMKNTLNKMLSGQADITEVWQNVNRLATNLISPVAAGSLEAMRFWEGETEDMPGTQAQDVRRILGMSDNLFNALDMLATPVAGQGNGT